MNGTEPAFGGITKSFFLNNACVGQINAIDLDNEGLQFSLDTFTIRPSQSNIQPLCPAEHFLTYRKDFGILKVWVQNKFYSKIGTLSSSHI